MSAAARQGAIAGLEALAVFGLTAIPCTAGWTVAGVHIAVGIAAAAVLALGAGFRRWLLRRTPADAAFAAFAIAAILATFGSAERGTSFVGLKKLLLIPVVHMAAGVLATPRRARLGLRLFVAGLALTAGVAIVHFVLVAHAADARLRTTGHYMTLAGLLLLATPLAAAAAAATRGRVRALYLLALAVLVTGLLLGFTRSAWLGAIVAVTVMLLRVRPRLAWLVVPGIAIAFALLPPAYRDRARSSFDPTHPNNLDRLRMWRAGVVIWRQHPWTGVGLVDLKPYVRAVRTSDAGQVHGHMHDNFMQILVMTGMLGLLAFVWLMVGVGRAAWVAGRAGPDAESHALGLGIWGAFWGFQVMGLFEWNFGDVEVTIALYFLFGAGIAAASAARGIAGLPGRATDLRAGGAEEGARPMVSS
jgi:O-antigen ligase